MGARRWLESCENARLVGQVLARLRHRLMSVLWPLSREKRKWLGHRQTDAIGPVADIDLLIRQHCCHNETRFSEYLSRNV